MNLLSEPIAQFFIIMLDLLQRLEQYYDEISQNKLTNGDECSRLYDIIERTKKGYASESKDVLFADSDYIINHPVIESKWAYIPQRLYMENHKKNNQE